MKKVNKTVVIPTELKAYFANNPQEKWENFKNECQTGYTEVISQLKKEQGGICCYCEIDFYDDRKIKDDFRVEHFHPKSDRSNLDINWNLIWSNLLGCCNGGSEKYILQGKRFIEGNEHRHCDILKGEHNWDDIILNPLDIPAFPPIFHISANGKMSVMEENCNQCNINRQKAKNCLDEKKLNLNAPKLREWRESLIDNLRNEIDELFQISQDLEHSITEVLSAHLSKDSNGNYSPFFTTIRSYLGEDAENFLNENGYDG